MKITLFPFLPVLLCMMGAMIMLLVLVAWNVREQTLNPAEATSQTLTVEEAEELRKKMEMQAEESDWFAKRYVNAQKESADELAERQANLALAEKETLKIKEEILRLEQLAQQLDSQASATPEEVEHLKRLLAEQQRRKAEAEAELAELQKEAAQREKSYAIVPSRAADGTFRRPIYIECRNDKIIIQPEGVELVPADFAALERPDNPFDTAIRVIRQYYVEMDQVVRGSEPYPLLIVRPSGIDMYENAHTRMASGNWVKDYGYEIVNEDWNIQYPEANEELRQRILQQLEVSRNRLTGYMIATQRGTPAQGYGTKYDGNGTLQQPQQYRMDHRGNVVPVDGGIRSAEDFRQVMAGRETGDGRRQTAADLADTPRKETAKDLAGTPGKETAADLAGTPGKETAADLAGTPGQGQGTADGGRQTVAEKMRPPNWALQGATQYTRGYSRNVRIVCETDRFMLPAQAGLTKSQVIPITDSVGAAADQLVQAIWEFQQSWDSAGENMHWKPILQVRVAPGAEQRLEYLKFHLKNSGLEFEE
ncbi:MAG: hypothetical protein LBI05_06720 [Planctomycetaceae bacterium]|jgi:hypothetical protein|nr:hypothetical protein [Planctomycetaceae bacterium]